MVRGEGLGLGLGLGLRSGLGLGSGVGLGLWGRVHLQQLHEEGLLSDLGELLDLLGLAGWG